MKPIADFQDGLPLVERLESAARRSRGVSPLADLPHVVFFDSAMRHPKLGRYSFVAADPVEWLVVPADGSDALVDIVRAICLQLPDEITARTCRRFKAAGPACSATSWGAAWNESRPRQSTNSSFPRWPSACTTSSWRSTISSEQPG